MAPDVTLHLHILSGAAALLAGPAALVAKKGGAAHVRWGRMYCAGMAGAGLTGMVLAYRFRSPLLLLLTVFACYLAFSGYRSAARQRCARRTWPGTGGDVVGLVVAGGSTVGLLVLAFQPGGPRAVPALFALMEAVLVACDAREMVSPSAGRTWRSAHIGKMLGAYVASVTAVSVVQLPQLGELRWLWPSLVGVPVILAVVRADRARGRCAAVGSEIAACP